VRIRGRGLHAVIRAERLAFTDGQRTDPGRLGSALRRAVYNSCTAPVSNRTRVLV